MFKNSDGTIVEYDGKLAQSIVTNIIDAVEESIEHINISSKIATIAIELTQNMMNYSKSENENSKEILPTGFIQILKDKDSNYFINTKNIISKDDKDKIEPVLKNIQQMDIKEIKQRYKELRRSGEQTHEKGGGIGFYEIAKLTSKIDFEFTPLNKSRFHFLFKISINNQNFISSI